MENKIDVNEVEIKFTDGTLTARVEIKFTDADNAFQWLGELLKLVKPNGFNN